MCWTVPVARVHALEHQPGEAEAALSCASRVPQADLEAKTEVIAAAVAEPTTAELVPMTIAICTRFALPAAFAFAPGFSSA